MEQEHLANELDRYLELCVYQKNLNPKTVKAYRIDLHQFLEYLSSQKKVFDREMLKEYIIYLNRHYKPRSVKRKIASLKAFFNYLEEEGLRENNPFNNFRIKLQEPFILPRTIPLKVIEQLLQAAYQALEDSKTTQEHKIALRDTAVMELLFATGMRISELCGLNKNHINLAERTVMIYGKGAKERIIQITNDSVVAILIKYIQEYQPKDTGPLFLTQRNTRLSEQSVRLSLRKYAEQIDASLHITPHMFRHSFATLLLEADVDIRYIQHLLGHSSIVTTQIYTHVANEKQRDILIKKHPRNKINI